MVRRRARRSCAIVSPWRAAHLETIGDGRAQLVQNPGFEQDPIRPFKETRMLASYTGGGRPGPRPRIFGDNGALTRRVTGT